MLVKSVLIAAVATFGLADAKCTLTGYTGDNCTGSKGAVRTISKSSSCIQVAGRESYKLEGNCGTVRVTKYNGYYCDGGQLSLNDLGSGCHSAYGKSLKIYIK
ncbi:hypothetical protein B0T10DRAFT_490366 [Thelonectria olida]|uniref:Uncharacterized protein n=1 Tax=Thelonectria olida TaxID=1576542 RepID=A0A9P8W345_9HYPO|nr:hypothetical protein B0T10DRAFT_490366 [Thelonectria olida]